MFLTKDYAFQIETTTRAIFNCDKFGLGVLADVEFIEKNPLIPIFAVLGNYYNKIDGKSKMKIDDFIETYYWLSGKSMEEIGEDKIKRIVKDFNTIVATV